MNYNIITSIICDGQPGKCNEDKGNVLENSAWVLDGATPLSKNRYFPGPSDAFWFVEQVDSALQTFSKDSTSLIALFNSAISHIQSNARKIQPSLNFESKFENPSCTVASINFNDDKLEYLLLCDCVIGVKEKRLPTKIIMDERLSPFDQHAISLISKVQHEYNISLQEAFEYARELLQQTRSKMNTQEGYWVLSLDGKGIEKAYRGNITLYGDCNVLLCTDGFSRIFELFKLCSIDDILSSSLSLNDALKLLREAEVKDKDCINFPRYKIHDDATAVLVQIR